MKNSREEPNNREGFKNKLGLKNKEGSNSLPEFNIKEDRDRGDSWKKRNNRGDNNKLEFFSEEEEENSFKGNNRLEDKEKLKS